MKRLFLHLAMLLMGVLTFAQETITVTANSEDISQSLDLRLVAQLFGKASNTEQFEIMLNNPDSAYTNLDLNGDGEIDYLRVVEAGTADNKLIVIQAVLAKDIYQDVASILVEKDVKTQEISVQIIGDEYIYGDNYIIEPVYIYRPVIYNWFWSARWYCWESPWYWGYYPRWWYVHHCWTHTWYWDRCHRFHRYHHYCSFRHGRHPSHNYRSISSSVSRRDYSTRHPEGSFSSRNTGYRNAGELRRTGSTRRESSVRAIDTRSTRVTTQRPSRTDNSVRQSASQPVSRTSGQQYRGSSSTQRTSQSTQRTTTTRSQGSSSGYRQQSTTSRTSSQTYQRPSSSQPSRSSSSSSVSRSPQPTRSSSGSVSRGGGSSRPSGGSSRSSGGGGQSSRRR